MCCGYIPEVQDASRFFLLTWLPYSLPWLCPFFPPLYRCSLALPPTLYRLVRLASGLAYSSSPHFSSLWALPIVTSSFHAGNIIVPDHPPVQLLVLFEQQSQSAQASHLSERDGCFPLLPLPGVAWRFSPPSSNPLPADDLGLSLQFLSLLFLSVLFLPTSYVYWVRLGFHIFLSLQEWSPSVVRGHMGHYWEIGADGFFCTCFWD